MPELPEVHALVADLRGYLVGREVTSLQLASFSALKTFDPPIAALNGLAVRAIERHGKYLDIAFDGPLHLIVHLALAGWIRKRAAGATAVKPTGRGPLIARMLLAGDSLPADGLDITEWGTRKSAAIWLVRDPRDVPGIERLGPDPLDLGFTIEQFSKILASAGRAHIKGVLRNQTLIAGIGNAYSDEILHAAKMSPYKPAAMKPDETAQLFEAMQRELRAAIDRAEGIGAADLKSEKKSNLKVHGRKGEPCPVCGDTIRQVTFADRAFQYCPACQTGGKPLADRVLSRLLK